MNNNNNNDEPGCGGAICTFLILCLSIMLMVLADKWKQRVETRLKALEEWTGCVETVVEK